MWDFLTRRCPDEGVPDSLPLLDAWTDRPLPRARVGLLGRSYVGSRTARRYEPPGRRPAGISQWRRCSGAPLRERIRAPLEMADSCTTADMERSR